MCALPLPCLQALALRVSMEEERARQAAAAVAAQQAGGEGGAAAEGAAGEAAAGERRRGRCFWLQNSAFLWHARLPPANL